MVHEGVIAHLVMSVDRLKKSMGLTCTEQSNESTNELEENHLVYPLDTVAILWPTFVRILPARTNMVRSSRNPSTNFSIFLARNESIQ